MPNVTYDEKNDKLEILCNGCSKVVSKEVFEAIGICEECDKKEDKTLNEIFMDGFNEEQLKQSILSDLRILSASAGTDNVKKWVNSEFVDLLF